MVAGAPCNVTPSRAVLISSGAHALNSRAQRLFQNETENGDRGRELSGTDSVLERRAEKKKTRTEDHFSVAGERSKALLAELGRREGRCYRLALISFTNECEMASSVVRTCARDYYRLPYPDPLFFSR